jgi:uncharacterized protein YjbJ (UPF0337 family)
VFWRTDPVGSPWIHLFSAAALPGIHIHFGEDRMNDDQVQGRIREVKGEVKKNVGKAAGNKSLEKEGRAQNVHGKLQAKFGDLREDIRKAADAKPVPASKESKE